MDFITYLVTSSLFEMLMVAYFTHQYKIKGAVLSIVAVMLIQYYVFNNILSVTVEREDAQDEAVVNPMVPGGSCKKQDIQV